MTVIGFVPARGGSTRIPRKNLRAVNGIPLVARTINVLRAAGIERVVVSTDDKEIADVARLWGAEIDPRPAELCGPGVRIDQVVDEWLTRHDDEITMTGEQWMVVAQPTSPLLSPASVANAVEHARDTGASVFTVTPERGLLWSRSTTPLFDVRRNSTDGGDPFYYRETGGLVVFDAAVRLSGGSWPPPPATAMELDDAEAIDIDDYADLVRARGGQKPSRIQLRYVESFELGSGHRRRCETLAAELQGRHLVEVVEHSKHPLPERYDVSAYGDTVDLAYTSHDLVVLDILDTKVEDVQSLYDNGVQYVITLEDLGLGALLADAVVNELYDAYPREDHRGKPATEQMGHITNYYGPKWAVLRAEFQGHPFRPRTRENGATVVVSFGGTDPSGMTEQVVDELLGVDAIEHLRIIHPPGGLAGLPDPMRFRAAAGPLGVTMVHNPVMAAEFLAADLAVTSSGRTVHEAAACGCPVIALPVNDRERMHDVCPGVAYLDDLDRLASNVESALMPENAKAEAERARLAYDAVDGLGAQRIAYLIDGLLGGML